MSDSKNSPSTSFDDLPDIVLRQIFSRTFKCETDIGSNGTCALSADHIQVCKRLRCLYNLTERTEIKTNDVGQFLSKILTKHFDPLLVKHEELAMPFDSTLWVIIAKYARNGNDKECVFLRLIPYGIHVENENIITLYKPKERTLPNGVYQSTVRAPNQESSLNDARFALTDHNGLYTKLIADIVGYISPLSLTAHEFMKVAFQFFVNTNVRTREYRQANNMKHLFNRGSMFGMKESNRALNKIIFEYVEKELKPQQLQGNAAAQQLQGNAANAIEIQQRKYTEIMNYYGNLLDDVTNQAAMQPLFDYILNYSTDFNKIVILGSNTSRTNGGKMTNNKREIFFKTKMTYTDNKGVKRVVYHKLSTGKNYIKKKTKDNKFAYVAIERKS